MAVPARVRLRVVALLGIVAIAVAALLAGCATANVDPFQGRRIEPSADDPAQAALARYRQQGDAADAALVATIAAQPTATWLLPEKDSTGEVAAAVHALDARVAKQHGIVVFVVYGVDHRDCGSASSGGLPDAQYRAWVRAIASGVVEGAGGSAAFVVEPDALAGAGTCASVATRTAEIAGDVRTLAATGAAVYIDAGNSAWVPAATMAARLKAADVADARGFATNVSNYQSLADERTYADHLSALVGGAHYVIDTSRNGNGATAEWCNPRGRALGVAPHAVTDGGAQDADLWIKQPGESDGTCNGGPAAGFWWPAVATELARNATR